MYKLLRWAAAHLALGIGLLAVREVIRASRQILLRGKVVVITGGSRGLGLLVARRFGHLALLNRFLPKYGGIGQSKVNGWSSRSAWSPSILTTLADRAASANNEGSVSKHD